MNTAMFMSAKDFASHTGLPYTAVIRLIHTGKLTASKIGRCFYVETENGHPKHLEYIRAALDKVLINDERQNSDELEERIFF